MDIKYRKCRMCLKKLVDSDKSLFDDDGFLLKRFNKCFHPKNVHNFAFEKNLACLCESCVSRLLEYLRIGHKTRANVNQFEEDPEFLFKKCVMCLEKFNSNTMIYPIFEGEYERAKKFGKCFNILTLHLLENQHDMNKICEPCLYKLEEFDMMRTTIRKFDIEYFGNPFYQQEDS